MRTVRKVVFSSGKNVKISVFLANCWKFLPKTWNSDGFSSTENSGPKTLSSLQWWGLAEYGFSDAIPSILFESHLVAVNIDIILKVNESQIEPLLRPVHTIRFQGSNFCWFRKSDRVNTVEMTEDRRKRMKIEHALFSSDTLLRKDERRWQKRNLEIGSFERLRPVFRTKNRILETESCEQAFNK